MDHVDETTEGQRSRQRVLHVVVGHGLRTYFVNCVRSVRSVTPQDEILVVDNASPDPGLCDELRRIAADDPKMRVLLRDTNSLVNGKVGGLYDAYRDAFTIALDEGFDFVHLVQGDLQMLWWDDDVIARATQIFAAAPLCVNIFTCALSSDWEFDGTLVESGVEGLTRIRDFGLLDMGLYDLNRWRQLGVAWDNDEREHGSRYLAQGFSVICHPWPTDAPIPWPAVVRRGVQRGREVRSVKSYLLKPLTMLDIEQVKSRNWTWLEEICVPWGWSCLTPMWTTHLNPDYLAFRRQEARRAGLRTSLPHWERSGLDDDSLRTFLVSQRRPSLWKLFVVVPLREMWKRVTKRLRAR